MEVIYVNIEIKSYTAGLVDGEGSIQINPSSSSSSKKKYWCLSVQVSGCCFEVFEELQKAWNLGGITHWTPSKGKAKQRSYNWRMYGKEAGVFLESILPYLRIKKINAEIAIDFLKNCGFKRGQISGEVRARRAELAMKMSEINRKYGKGKCKKNFDLNNIV